MQMLPVHDQLRQARLKRREDLAAIATRIGVRETILQAIEAGDYAKLPSGLYGRAAIRAFAESLGFDGQAILDECADQLAPLEDPIAGLARVRGLRSHADGSSPSMDGLLKLTSALIPSGAFHSTWRFLAAAAIDTAVVLALLMMLVVATITVFGRPVLNSGAAPAFGIVGMLLATSYFAMFGGIAGQTAGARLARVTVPAGDGAPLDLARVMTRALRSAARDVLVVEQSAAWLRRISASYRSSASRRDRQRAEQPARS